MRHFNILLKLLRIGVSMNPNKPSQIFSEFKDYFNKEEMRLENLKSNNLLGLKDIGQHKLMSTNVKRGQNILNKKNIQHFILPDNGYLMDDHLVDKPLTDIVQKYLRDQHLPFPMLSIEFDCTLEGQEEDQIKNLKTLLIVQEHREFNQSTSYLIIESIHKIQIDNRIIYLAVPETFLLDIDVDRVKERNGVCTYYYTSNGEKAVLNENIHNSYASISKVIALMVALSCKNVGIKKSNPISSKINQERQRKGLTAHRSYNFIVVDTTYNQNLSSSCRKSASTKSTHVRRGHVRHFQDKNIWIEQTVINANKSELTKKNYMVK